MKKKKKEKPFVFKHPRGKCTSDSCFNCRGDFNLSV